MSIENPPIRNKAQESSGPVVYSEAPVAYSELTPERINDEYTHIHVGDGKSAYIHTPPQEDFNDFVKGTYKSQAQINEEWENRPRESFYKSWKEAGKSVGGPTIGEAFFESLTKRPPNAAVKLGQNVVKLSKLTDKE